MMKMNLHLFKTNALLQNIILFMPRINLMEHAITYCKFCFITYGSNIQRIIIFYNILQFLFLHIWWLEHTENDHISWRFIFISFFKIFPLKNILLYFNLKKKIVFFPFPIPPQIFIKLMKKEKNMQILFQSSIYSGT